MNKDDLYYLGRISKPFGNKGHVVVFMDVDDPDEYSRLDSVYLDLDGEFVPFLILSVEIQKGKKALIHFEDVDSVDDADAYAGREMYLPVTALPQLKGKKFYYHEVKGFRVIDQVHGEIGSLLSVMDLPRQPLLQVMQGKKEILIPLVDEVIVKVDRRKKELHIRAPEGLIEIYL
jgi:16S rRNA processing protein RimM